MKPPKHSLRKVVILLNNSDEDGGFSLQSLPHKAVAGHAPRLTAAGQPAFAPLLGEPRG